MKLAIISIFLFLSVTAFSQRQYFVFIENESKEPIYARIGETTFNSSSIGHLIIPQISDSTYTIEVGFPGDKYPSNQFIIKINRKDHGYQLKRLPDKGWVLFNFQTMELITPVKKESMVQSGYSLIKRSDGFARLLSQVVNDTAVLYSIVYEKPVEPVAKADRKVTLDTPATVKQQVIKPEETQKQTTNFPAIVKVEEMQTDSGKSLAFLDNKDSIKIFIPAEDEIIKNTSTAKEPKAPPSDAPQQKQDKLAAPVVTTEVEKQAATNKTTETNPSPKIEQATTRDTDTPEKKLVIYNSDCKAIAWDNDVDKVRLKMLAEKDVDNKINAARKIFKTKCFTAAQIKALTELFLTDQDKYKFLDAAYPFAIDTENFKQLSYLLTDEYYVKRFRAMVRLD